MNITKSILTTITIVLLCDLGLMVVCDFIVEGCFDEDNHGMFYKFMCHVRSFFATAAYFIVTILVLIMILLSILGEVHL